MILFSNIDWPNNNPVVNEKDLKYPLFNDILKNGDFFGIVNATCGLRKLVEINDFGEMPLSK